MTHSAVRPIGPVNVKVSGNILDFSKIILGGATFSRQYNSDPELLGVENLVKRAFDLGINTIDTSPYYGDSEIIIGNALQSLKPGYPRENYYICTKVGRIALDEFDYSPAWVVQSVRRSLQRLGTDYLDLVYLHDVEFQPIEKILGALTQLKQLKDQGLVRNFGISGYPVKFLVEVACQVVEVTEIGKLDAVLSYCQYNIQNTKLEEYYQEFFSKAKIRQLSNASILSMSLLRSAEVKPFHPGSDTLKGVVKAAARTILLEDHQELAELATRFAIRGWSPKGPTVIGISTIQELESAVEQYQLKDNETCIKQDEYLVEKFRRLIGPSHVNETWPSGLH